MIGSYQEFSAEHLYALLPAIIRQRDLEEGQPLKALIGVLAEQGRSVEQDIEDLYNNIFVETCEDWAVSYIGDLLRCAHLHGVDDAGFSQRAYVANTIGYRRRKGTLGVMEALAHDTTGWSAHGREFFSTLSTTQNINHVRHGAPAMADIGDVEAMALIDGAFDTQPRGVDVRHIDGTYGQEARHHISNIGLYLWRLQSYSLSEVTARQRNNGGNDGFYFIDYARRDLCLFNKPKTEHDITQISQETNVPAPLRRIPLYMELEKRRQDIVDGYSVSPVWFDNAPPFRIYVQQQDGDDVTEIPFEEILVCNLETFKRPKKKKAYTHSRSGDVVELPIQVAIDPENGRIAFPSRVKPFKVLVDYAYGFSGDYGAGAYQRYNDVSDLTDREVNWHVAVTQSEAPVANSIFATLSEAVEAWNNQPAGTVGLISIMDNHIYEESLSGASGIAIPEGSLLVLSGADWPELPTENDGELRRIKGRVDGSGLAPRIIGNIDIRGGASINSDAPGEIILDGLCVTGNVNIDEGENTHLGMIDIRSCTLGNGSGILQVNGDDTPLVVSCSKSVLSAVDIASGIQKLSITDTILSKGIDARAAFVSISSSTILGNVWAQEIFAQNTIFSDVVVTKRQQTGCLRFCFVSSGSVTPRKYRCLPDIALKDSETGDALPSSEQNRIKARLVPSFTSEEFGHHAYGQLDEGCDVLFKNSAEDGNEMGIFQGLKGTYRQKNMTLAGREYLRFGLQYGALFES
ncbi:MAG: hypothetical protein ACRBDL_07105 [Alphaproteobacteria bacterium]